MIFVNIFLSLCIPFTTYAQHDSLRISLDELFARGAEQHLQLHADRLKEQMAEERIRDARTARMPDISIGLKGGCWDNLSYGKAD